MMTDRNIFYRIYKSFATLPQHFYCWWFNVAPSKIDKHAPSYYWFRELLHFSGGALFGTTAALLANVRWWAFFIPLGLNMALVGTMETVHYRHGQTVKKTITDVSAWALGFVAGAVACSFAF